MLCMDGSDGGSTFSCIVDDDGPGCCFKDAFAERGSSTLCKLLVGLVVEWDGFSLKAILSSLFLDRQCVDCE